MNGDYDSLDSQNDKINEDNAAQQSDNQVSENEFNNSHLSGDGSGNSDEDRQKWDNIQSLEDTDNSRIEALDKMNKGISLRKSDNPMNHIISQGMIYSSYVAYKGHKLGGRYGMVTGAIFGFAYGLINGAIQEALGLNGFKEDVIDKGGDYFE